MQDRIHDALKRGAVDEATVLAKTWVAEAPDSVEPQRALAAALSRGGDAPGALAALDRAIALAPEAAWLHFERAGLLAHANQKDDAQQGLARSLELNPNLLPAYIMQAHLALARDDVGEAERVSVIAARISADDPRLAVVDAAIALRKGENDRALSLASSAASALSEDRQALSVLALAHMAKQHWAFAEQVFRRLAELVPDARVLQPMLAQLALRQGRADDAADLLRPLLDDAVIDTPAMRRLVAMCEMQAGRSDRALPDLKRAFAARPDDLQVLDALMDAWTRTAATDDARATLEAMLATHPAVAAIWAARLSLETMGDDASDALLRRWTQAMPGHLPALEAAMFSALRGGKLEQAGDWARQARDVAADPIRFEQVLIEIELSDDADAALRRVDALIDAQTDPSIVAEMRAWRCRLLDQCGRTGEAVAAWLQAQQHAGDRLLALPALSPDTDALPPVAEMTEQAPRPLFVWGAPGSAIERIIDMLGRGGLPVLVDRFTSTPPVDLLQSADSGPLLASGALQPLAVASSWQAALAGRGAGNGNAVDWLPWWDNGLLQALRQGLPGGRLLSAIRDPRDMLLDWLVTGAATPLRIGRPADAATWLAALLSQLAMVEEQQLYPVVVLRVDDLLDDPEAFATRLGGIFGIRLPATAVGMRRLPAGRWRAYTAELGDAFALLTPVAVRLGYPEA